MLNRATGQPFRIAQLRSLPDKVGMNLLSTSSGSGFGLMHDGRVDSLSRFLTAGFSCGVLTNDPTRTTADLIAFLFSFAGGGPRNGQDGDHSAQGVSAAVGRQLTFTFPEVPAFLDDMVEQTESPQFPVDLVIRGTQNGLARSWFLDRENGYFQSDRNDENTTLDALVSPGKAPHSGLPPVQWCHQLSDQCPNRQQMGTRKPREETRQRFDLTRVGLRFRAP